MQADLMAKASAEITRLTASLREKPPALWFTYHCHYKAPDLVGPDVARSLGIRYAISEPSISPRRRDGPWSDFACASEAAIAAADQLFWTTERDRPALEDAGHASRMTHLPAFLDPGSDPPARKDTHQLRLITVAMMRKGDKLESYLRLARALRELDPPWVLEVIGDGEARSDVEDAFRGLPVQFHGQEDDPARLRAALQGSDLLVWPGVGEGVGMAWLEAQAAGLGVIAEAHPAARSLVGAGVLCPPDNARAFAQAIANADPAALSPRARAHVVQRHSLDAAAVQLGTELRALIA